MFRLHGFGTARVVMCMCLCYARARIWTCSRGTEVLDLRCAGRVQAMWYLCNVQAATSHEVGDIVDVKTQDLRRRHDLGLHSECVLAILTMQCSCEIDKPCC